MKKFVTTFLSVLAVAGLSSVGFAQSTAPQPVTPAIAKVLDRPALPSGITPVYHMNERLSPLVEDQLLNYYNTDGTFSYWPLGDTLLDANGNYLTNPNGSPYIRFMYLERFSPEGAKPVIDSIRLAFIVDTLQPVSGNHFVLQFFNQTTTQFTNGDVHVVPNLAASLRTVSISTAKMPGRGGVVDTMLKFNRTGTMAPVKLDMSDTLGDNAGNVFVGLSIYYATNHILMVADSNNDSRTTLDESVDRSYYIAFSADGQYYTQGFLGGRYYTGTDHTTIYYPNLIMDAYYHDAGAGVGTEQSQAFSLEQNFPNSFNKETSIRYSLNESGPVSLKVYNTLGNEVATIASGFETAGSHEVSFNGNNLPNGTYFYTLRAGDKVATRSMIVSK